MPRRKINLPAYDLHKSAWLSAAQSMDRCEYIIVTPLNDEEEHTKRNLIRSGLPFALSTRADFYQHPICHMSANLDVIRKYEYEDHPDALDEIYDYPAGISLQSPKRRTGNLFLWVKNKNEAFDAYWNKKINIALEKCSKCNEISNGLKRKISDILDSMKILLRSDVDENFFDNSKNEMMQYFDNDTLGDIRSSEEKKGCLLSLAQQVLENLSGLEDDMSCGLPEWPLDVKLSWTLLRASERSISSTECKHSFQDVEKLRIFDELRIRCICDPDLVRPEYQWSYSRANSVIAAPGNHPVYVSENISWTVLPRVKYPTGDSLALVGPRGCVLARLEKKEDEVNILELQALGHSDSGRGHSLPFSEESFVGVIYAGLRLRKCLQTESNLEPKTSIGRSCSPGYRL
jgi:hypothetical protein